MINFIKILESKKIRGSESRRRVILSQWSATQRLLESSGLKEVNPRDWHDLSETLFDAAVSNQTSYGYFVKILELINLYGRALASHEYTNIKSPRGFNKQRFLDLCPSNASAPMTEPLLKTAESRFNESEYRFLRASFYLGLRPTEIDSCRSWNVETRDGVRMLLIYQSKLGQVSKDARFKVIPLLEVEQQAVVSEIQAGLGVVRPHLSKVHAVFGDSIHLYAGRKGLVRWLMDRGYSEYDCSAILGHSSINTTRSYYTDHSHAKRAIAMGIARKRSQNA